MVLQMLFLLGAFWRSKYSYSRPDSYIRTFERSQTSSAEVHTFYKHQLQPEAPSETRLPDLGGFVAILAQVPRARGRPAGGKGDSRALRRPRQVGRRVDRLRHIRRAAPCSAGHIRRAAPYSAGRAMFGAPRHIRRAAPRHVAPAFGAALAPRRSPGAAGAALAPRAPARPAAAGVGCCAAGASDPTSAACAGGETPRLN